jgi:long-chain alkane monooxygenase
LADEYLQIVYALWEGGWADDAVKRDRGQGIYTDPRRVRPVRHHGKQFHVDAVPLWEPSPQRTPVLYQAGASDRGRVFAARHAECAFVNASTKQNVVRRIVSDLRTRAAPRPMLVFVGASVVTGRTEKEARDLLAEYRRHASVEGALAHAAASLGIDFAAYDVDEPIQAGATQAIRSNVEAIAASLGPGWSKRQLIDRFVLGSRQPPIVGSPEQVADQLIAWVEEADVDGFNLSRTVVPECLESFIDLVVPLLQEQGAYKRVLLPAPTGKSCSAVATGCPTCTQRRRRGGSSREDPGRHRCSRRYEEMRQGGTGSAAKDAASARIQWTLEGGVAGGGRYRGTFTL